MNINVLVLAAGVSLAAVFPVWAEFTTVRQWTSGRIIVEQVRQPDGSQICRFAVAAQNAPETRFKMARFTDGVEDIYVGNPAQTWQTATSVTFEFSDGQASWHYYVTMWPSVYGGLVVQSDSGSISGSQQQQLRQEIANSSRLTVIIDGQRYYFTLPGGNVAFAQLARCGETIVTEAAASGRAAPGSVASQQPHQVALRRGGGDLLVLDVTVGTLTLPFEFDSGATSVSMPRDVADRLFAAGALSEADRLDDITVSLADGSTHRVRRYMLRSITVGGVTVTDVKCTVGPPGTSLLLGQSFMRKFSSWSIDNARNVLVLGPPTS